MNFEELADGPDLSVLGRGRWERDLAVGDLDLLWWIGRFRFVTGEAIADWLGISWQRANSRVRRLERLRLVRTWQRSVCEPRAVFLTGAAMELLGQPRRRAPRPDVQREHEAAVVSLCTHLERSDPEATVLTERECRRAERIEKTHVYRVELTGSGGRGDRTRWPDLVSERDGRRTAHEIEFAPKGKSRLEGIVRAYDSSFYDRVVFYVRAAFVARLLHRLVMDRHAVARIVGRVNDFSIETWPGLPDAQREAIAAAIPPIPPRPEMRPPPPKPTPQPLLVPGPTAPRFPPSTDPAVREQHSRHLVAKQPGTLRRWFAS